MNRKDTIIHVAVGVVKDHTQRILIARRQQGQHLAGLWEFPGGKVEPDEDICQALYRELKEELGIDVVSSEPLIQIVHHYAEKSVLLDVHVVTRFKGEANGIEGQELAWVEQDGLASVDFPEANNAIVNALNLPSMIGITAAAKSISELEVKLYASLESGAGMILLRESVEDNWQETFKRTRSICDQSDISVSVNSGLASLHQLKELAVNALHLKSVDLMRFDKSQLEGFGTVSASCHSLLEIQKANEMKLDFILVSPVKKTSSHPQMDGIGWSGFKQLVREAQMPVYALGGMSLDYLAEAKIAGGQGIASISMFWD